MRINTNLAALNTWRSLTSNQTNLEKSLQRLSSGYRINRAADDAAGLAVSEKMKSQIRGINLATRNAQDGVSLVQTAEGSASQIQDMLQRMRELAVQASSETLGDSDRSQLSLEFEQLKGEIKRTSDTANFNGITLLASGGVGFTTKVSDSTIGAVDTAATAASNLVINVNQKADYASVKGTGATYKANIGTDAGAYKLSLTIVDDGASATTNINLSMAADSTITADDVADAINGSAAGASVHATVAEDGKLQITSLDTGADQSIQVDEYFDSDADPAVTATPVFFGAGQIGAANATVGQDLSYTIDNGTAVSTVTAHTNSSVQVNGGAGPIIDFTGALGRMEVDSTNNATTTSITVQVGASGAAGNSMNITIDALTYATLDNLDTLQINTKANITATNPLTHLDTAIATVSGARAKLGAQQNRLENAIGTLQAQSENLTAAESRIRDVDMASEMANFTKFQILTQASTAMLAQANQLSQGILTLLR